MQFNNPEVAAAYESLVEVDRPVHKPGVYSGQLSNITPEMATAMVAQQSNLIKEKAAPVAAEVLLASSGKTAKAESGR